MKGQRRSTNMNIFERAAGFSRPRLGKEIWFPWVDPLTALRCE